MSESILGRLTTNEIQDDEPLPPGFYAVMAGTPIVMCWQCGAVVGDMAKHTDWHEHPEDGVPAAIRRLRSQVHKSIDAERRALDLLDELDAKITEVTP